MERSPIFAADEVISQDLNITATDVYFSYISGAIGTSGVQGAMRGSSYQTAKFWGHRMSGDALGGGA